MYWRPFPSRAPSPNENSGLSRPSSPPDGESTNPVRTVTTRAPASRAAAVAASQSTHRPRQEARTGGSGLVHRAVAGVAVVADGTGVDQRRHPGFRDRLRQHLGGIYAAVPQALLERTRPASTADADAAQVHYRVNVATTRWGPGRRRRDSSAAHRNSTARDGRCATPGGPRRAARKPEPSRSGPRSLRSRWWLMPLLGPVLQAQIGLEGAFFESLLDCRQEAPGVRAVDQAVVVGQR